MSRAFISSVCLLLSGFWLLTSAVNAAIFPGNARVEVTDSTGGLSWNTTNSALTVQCWFKISIPSGTNLTENMTILANRRTGTTSDAYAFLLEFDINTGNVEFSSRGTGLRQFTLVERPFLDRWYHVAVVRQNEQFDAYVDGRVITVPAGAAVGDARTTDGVSIGGWNATGGQGRYLFGDVQEVSIYQTALSQDFIVQNLFTNQPAIPELKGYFKLGFSTNAADNLRNFAPAPLPTGTDFGTKQGSGNVEFEESNQAGEQSAFDSRKNGGRDAMAPLSGAFSWSQTAISRPTPGVALDLRFGYSSANAFGGFKLGGTDPYAAGPIGKGWRHTFETRVVPAQAFSPLADTDTVGLMNWDGAIETWDRDPFTFEYSTRSKEYRGEFIITTTNSQWTTPERLVYTFKRPDAGAPVMRGRLLSIRDFNSNSVQVLWNETSGVITQIVDSASGRYTFNYQSSLLTNVTFGPWSVNFGYDTTNRLISKSITNTSGLYTNVNTTWRFEYNANGLLARVTDPRNFTNTFVQYDQYGRKTNEMDALIRATATRYGVPGKRQITHLDPGGFSWIETYDRKGHILAQQDPLANITSYSYDTNGNRISITEPLGWKTLFAYDSRANVIARTNELGEVTRWVFHSFFNKAVQEIDALNWTNFYAYDAAGNLTNHSDALGSLVRYAYTTNGLVTSATDANGNLARFAYDTNGFLMAQTDPATNTTSFALNEVGWKLAQTNALGQITAFAYDLNGNVVRTLDPLQRIFTKTFDANGNLLSASDAKNQFTFSFYDAANQRTQTVDRVSATNGFFYTQRGKLDRATDALGNTANNFYDTANRLIATSDPLGQSVTNVYDANGNVVTMIDKLGRPWGKTYDRLNRVFTESDPLGDTKRTTYDPVGRIKTVTTPNGFVSIHDYDGRGRLTKWVDAENFQWLYAYDGVGNITNITDALSGHYVMAYGSRNERTLEHNQDNFEWTYAYDKLLRPERQVDPNGLIRTIHYDDGGRIDYADFSTGRVDDHQYDENNNLTLLSRSRPSQPPTSSTFAYDAMDRVTEYTDAFGKKVKYGYDQLSRITALTYPGNLTVTNNYDPLSRLTNQVDWAGRQLSYAYDQASRLIRRTYPNGVVQTNTFDTAGRLTGLSHSPSTINSNTINVALTYAYDRNGNKSASTEKGTYNWPMPSLLDETSRFTASGRITNRVDALNPTNNYTYNFDPSGNMTNASGGGQSWGCRGASKTGQV